MQIATCLYAENDAHLIAPTLTGTTTTCPQESRLTNWCWPTCTR